MKIKAMSLVELSVAMAIIALIITTTLTAFSLIYKTTVLEAIRSITTLETKTAEFQATFGRLPGDMEYATDYWNLDEFKSFCQYKNSSNISLNIAKGFDGDGDGYVDIEKNNISSTDNFTESSAFMCHLRLADMITHNPVVVKLVSTQKQINNLALPTKNKGMYLLVAKPLASWKHQYISHAGKNNEIILVSNDLSTVDKWPSSISRKEAFLLDKKIDDGEPGLGKIRCKGILFDCCYNSTKEKECVENSSYYIDNKRNGILVLYAGAIAKY